MCKACGRQFVADKVKKQISDAQEELIDRLLLEKTSLAGICRVVEVSQVWLQEHISELYASQPEDLCACIPDKAQMQAHLEERLGIRLKLLLCGI